MAFEPAERAARATGVRTALSLRPDQLRSRKRDPRNQRPRGSEAGTHPVSRCARNGGPGSLRTRLARGVSDGTLHGVHARIYQPADVPRVARALEAYAFGSQGRGRQVADTDGQLVPQRAV